ncbi:type I restriction enzyme, R subunit [Flexibacter flexilis DSM 6793]|uniref:Type I restriction enzyme endonuclease subunit n=1 Tax=Flexibacter flexilis DSM 6793 TaxID=927664 RepID=A0A1I1NV46_9BACT|nr:HsdR family type I site-specific deoxyribonuclease [Flexibacter flexilis]SFD01541.1 type I restriction enzyme, R subunit [Flexibacter flexilis DSM 6793]
MKTTYLSLSVPAWKQATGREWQKVELPLLNQLATLHWDVLLLKGKMEGVQYPQDSGRRSFSEVILREMFEASLLKINPWLTAEQVAEVYQRLTTYTAGSLLENNQHILELLLENTSVSVNHQTGDKSPTVKIIDFDNVANNTFTAISQLKVAILGTDKYIFPDITLFINGIPVAIVECKADDKKDPIAQAIEQINRYAEHAGHEGQGNKNLFYYNQIVVATCGNIAKFGSITTKTEKHFYRWTDPYPLTLQDLEDSIGSHSDQARLVAGMFSPKNLLDLIRCYTVFYEVSNRKVKVVGRYQQFRAVKLILERLKQGRNPQERSGIVWHTQGSGKSLTMMFLVREMKKSNTDLKQWKIVFVTDRTDLEDQLQETSAVIGYSVQAAAKIKDIPAMLRSDTSDVSLIMIQKFQTNDIVQLNLGELNTSDRILVMTDEAHRSQYKELRAQLNAALPYATHVGFTGTPIEKTEKVFGEYIDKYTMRQAIDDGVTLEIVYEGRTHNAEISDSDAANQMFADVFADYDDNEQTQILINGVRMTRRAYLEANETIRAKAKDMIDHYVTHVFTNGFKAQVVATSRLACARYSQALQEALAEKVAALKQHNPYHVNIPLLETLEVGVVISGSQNDTSDLTPFTNSSKHKTLTERFKLSFDEQGDSGTGAVGILVVNNMLLTGFDAPIEQVMYLDKVIVAHNLLQTIARVNRVGAPSKEVGFIVDYVGVGHHLKHALNVYDELEQSEILACLGNDSSQLNELIETHEQLMNFLKEFQLNDLDDTEMFFDLFYDEEIRFKFVSLYKAFAKALDVVMPQKEALPYLQDFKQLSLINVQAAKHTRDQHLNMSSVSEKLRLIVDEYLVSKGIDQKVPPLSILDKEFMSEVSLKKRAKTKAAEIEHAIRNYLTEHLDEDPELYSSFAQLLEEILLRNQNNWEQVYEELKDLLERLKKEQEKESYGLDKKAMRFFRSLHKQLFDNAPLDEDNNAALVNVTQQIMQILRTEMALERFWEPHRHADQNRLKGALQDLLLESPLIEQVKVKRAEICSRLMELAKANNDEILYN